MLIPVSRVSPTAGLTLKETLDKDFLVELVAGYGGYEVDGGLELDLVLSRLIQGVHITGTLSCRFRGVCARCVAKVPLELSFRVTATFLPAPEALSSEDLEIELMEEELDFTYYRGEELDLTDFLREAVLVELPGRLLCKQDCQGLCATCGVDLNEGQCSCPSTNIDPRWSELLAIRERMIRKN